MNNTFYEYKTKGREAFNRNRTRNLLLFGVLLGYLLIGLIRFVAVSSDAVHTHANFRMFINGERELFDSAVYYEEVQACGGDEQDNPKTRVHMHDNVPHEVHVHDAGSTWGHFFANLGWTLGDDVVVDRVGNIYPDPTYILNGQRVRLLANQAIVSEDRLLIDIGDTPRALVDARFDEVESTAAELNGKYDPAGCSGGQELSFTDRLKYAFGLPKIH